MPNLAFDADNTSTFLHIQLNGNVHVYNKSGKAEYGNIPYAIGTGSEFAYTALALGHDAGIAVLTACKLDVYSGGTIFSESLDRSSAAYRAPKS